MMDFKGKLTDRAFVKDFCVRYSDTDEKNALSAANLVNILQTECINHSAAAGHGLDYFKDTHTGWAVSHWHIWVDSLPKEGDYIHVSTWSKPFRHAQAHRDISIEDETGHELIHASCRWVLMDTESRHPIKTEAIMDDYCFETALPYSDEKFRMPSSSEDADIYDREFTVERSDMDVNGHTNNASYIKWAVDDIPDDIFMSHTLKEMIVKYHKECAKGDHVKSECAIEKADDGRLLIISTQYDADDPKKMLCITASYWEKED